MKKGFFMHMVNFRVQCSPETDIFKCLGSNPNPMSVGPFRLLGDLAQVLGEVHMSSVSFIRSGEVESSLSFPPLQFPYSQDFPQEGNVQTIPFPILCCNFLRFGIHLCQHCLAKYFS